VVDRRKDEVSDGWGGDSSAAKNAFDDEGVGLRGRNVTLTLGAPAILDDEPGRSTPSLPAPVALGEPIVEPLHYDAWNADRLKRASLPPSAASAPPAAPITPLPPSRPDAELEADEGDAFALVSRSTGTMPALDLVAEMAERFALGDFSGSLRAAELILGQNAKHGPAQHYARETQQKLETLYRSRLEAQGRIPHLALAENEVRWLGLDAQVGHVLSRIDGISDYEHVVDASGMPKLTALRTLVELVDSRVVRLV
jgi:hypothetical protein